MLPSSYHPTQPTAFIGPARATALYCQQLARQVLANGKDPFRTIFCDPPGVGKSKLANYLAGLLGSSQWNTTKLCGTQATVDQVEGLARQFHLTDLFGGYRLLWLEEIDSMPPVARSRMLMLCDDMPSGWALIGTSNLTPAKFKEMHPPTQRRYTFLEVAPPTGDEIFAFLLQHWPGVPAASVRNIAVMSCGCVGAALQEMDAEVIVSQMGSDLVPRAKESVPLDQCQRP